MRGSCPDEKLTAVKDIKYSTKLLATCELSNLSGCCDYDASDCLTVYKGTDQQRACSGRELCKDVNIAQAERTSCGESYQAFNHYLTMEYYCINGKLKG